MDSGCFYCEAGAPSGRAGTLILCDEHVVTVIADIRARMMSMLAQELASGAVTGTMGTAPWPRRPASGCSA